MKATPPPYASQGQQKTAALLPEPGVGRWWKVERVKRVKTPIRVTLMECMVPGRKGLSTELASEHSIASREAVAAAAQLVLDQVGAYRDVVGHYGEPEAPANTTTEGENK